MALFFEGVAQSATTISTFSNLFDLQVEVSTLFLIGAAFWPYLYLVFLGTIPSRWSRPFAHLPGRIVALLVPVAVVSAVFIDPALVTRAPGDDGIPALPPLGWSIYAGAPLISLYGLIVALSYWRGTRPGTLHRKQAAAYMAAFGARDIMFVLFGLGILVNSFWPAMHTSAIAWFPVVGTLLFVPFAAYGVLATHLFDIDLKVRWTLHRGTVLGVLALVFFLVKEGSEYLLPLEGLVPSLVGAAVIAICAAPFWRILGRGVDRLFPTVRATPDYLEPRKHEVYQATVEAMLLDGSLGERDRSILQDLRLRFGIDPDVADRLEVQLLAALHEGQPKDL